MHFIWGKPNLYIMLKDHSKNKKVMQKFKETGNQVNISKWTRQDY